MFESLFGHFSVAGIVDGTGYRCLRGYRWHWFKKKRAKTIGGSSIQYDSILFQMAISNISKNLLRWSETITLDSKRISTLYKLTEG